MDYTWSYITTVLGAGAISSLIVQLIKSVFGLQLKKWRARLATYLIGTALLLLGTYFSGGLDWSGVALCFINGAAVYFAATGEYHTVVKELTGEKVKAGDKAAVEAK